jgi:RNA recognition motif-containing protein
MKKIFAGNFSWNTTEDELKDLFAEYGTVQSCTVVKDRETGRSRGFGFIEMDDAGAAAAIKALDGMEHDGRALRVNEADDKPRGDRGGNRSGGNRGGGNRW